MLKANLEIQKNVFTAVKISTNLNNVKKYMFQINIIIFDNAFAFFLLISTALVKFDKILG